MIKQASLNIPKPHPLEVLFFKPVQLIYLLYPNIALKKYQSITHNPADPSNIKYKNQWRLCNVLSAPIDSSTTHSPFKFFFSLLKFDIRVASLKYKTLV